MQALFKVAADERAMARDLAVRDAGASWLIRKGESAGCGIDPDRLLIDGYDKVRIPRDGGRAITFSTLTFQDVLTVRDPTQFLASMMRGFGAAKAFGCGLMLVWRAVS